MQWFVYIVECNDNTLYTGITNNIELRIQKHNTKKGAKYTKARLPVKLIYNQECASKSAALKEEYRIKQLTKKEKLELIRNCNQTTPIYEQGSTNNNY